MTNIPHLIETALLLLIAYLIGCVIGYILRTKVFNGANSGAQSATKPASVASAAPSGNNKRAAKPPANKSAPKPVTAKLAAQAASARLDKPRDGKQDNLKLIKGIGPKIEGKLNEMGIFHFDQIAVWDKETIDKVDADLSFKGRIDRERWVPQAKALAKK